MALTQSFIHHNLIGSKREDYIFCDFDSVTSGTVKTRLSWIDVVIPAQRAEVAGAAADLNITCVPNSPSPGQMSVSGVLSNAHIILLVIGR